MVIDFLRYVISFVLSLTYHFNQRDKAGKFYFLHPYRVSKRVKGLKTKSVALLHDIVEDTSINKTFLFLLTGKEIYHSVITLTKSNNITYQSYIQNIKQNSLSTKVKISDLIDNMNLGRLKEVNQEDVDRVIRYAKLLKELIR